MVITEVKSMKNKLSKLLVLLLVALLASPILIPELKENINTQEIVSGVSQMGELPKEILSGIEHQAEQTTSEQKNDSETQTDITSNDNAAFELPPYDGKPYSVINNNIPFFTETTTECFEEYPELDSLGRCGAAYACVGIDTMPTEERESISQVKPSGWHNNPYDFVDGGYVYNRCHLIGFQLTGENANERNLVTGTRYMNVQGMLPFENEVADYIASTGNHVMYRVTPIFEGNNLVCSGVLMEAYSVEDDGSGVQFCVYCFNVQPGVVIDYSTGENYEDVTYFLPQNIGK